MWWHMVIKPLVLIHWAKCPSFNATGRGGILTLLWVQRRHQCECASSDPHQQHIPLQSIRDLWFGNKQKGSPRRDVLHYSQFQIFAFHTSSCKQNQEQYKAQCWTTVFQFLEIAGILYLMFFCSIPQDERRTFVFLVQERDFNIRISWIYI